MKWYGSSETIKPQKNLVRNYKRRLSLQSRSAVLVCNSRVNYHQFPISVFIPAMWTLTHLKDSKLPRFSIFMLFSETYFYNLVLPSRYLQFYYCRRTNCLNFIFFFYNNYFNLYWFFFNLVFNSLSLVFFNKLKFRGKGYYVYKNRRNTIAFQFGYSHRIRIFTHFVGAKLLSKTSVLFFGVNKFDVLRASYFFFRKRPISIFTGKGVRFTRQVIYKKTGKISSYR